MTAAFVGGLSVAGRPFAGRSVNVGSDVVVRSRFVMQMSKSVPFLLKPKNLDSSMPAGFEFDPLHISEIVPVKYLQESEIKHGRVCMLAALGFIVQEAFTWGAPGFPKMLAVDAHDYYLVNGGAMFQIMLFCAMFEGVSFYAVKDTLDGKREPGYFGFDPLGLGKDPAQFKKYQTNEIMNGRLAMIAVAGMIHQEFVTKQPLLESLTHFKANTGGL